MDKSHYENHDALLQAAIGGVAVIIFNILSHLNLINLFFGFGADPVFVVQTITVFIMVIITWLLTRYGRPPEHASMPPPTISAPNSQPSPHDRQQSQSQPWAFRLLNAMHFHYPIVFKPLIHHPKR